MDNKKHVVLMGGSNFILEVASKEVGEQIEKANKDFCYIPIGEPFINSLESFEKYMNFLMEKDNKKWEKKKFHELDL